MEKPYVQYSYYLVQLIQRNLAQASVFTKTSKLDVFKKWGFVVPQNLHQEIVNLLHAVVLS